MPCIKKIDLTYEYVSSRIGYNPDEGSFFWKVDASKNIKAGSPAGCFKGTRKSVKSGLSTRYLYIRIDNYEIPAGRIAWLLMTKEWPQNQVLFVDFNSENLKFSNLKLGQQVSYTTDQGEKKRAKISSERQHNYGLKRYYGIDLSVYQKMLLDQNGVCGICGKPETSVVNGKLKPLAVDHCHNSTKIRGLLCARCNQAIGLLNEDQETLRKAIDYLNKHQKSDSQD